MVDPEFDYGDEDEDEEEESESDEDEQEEPSPNNNNNAQADNGASNVSINCRNLYVLTNGVLCVIRRTMPMRAQGKELWRPKKKSNWQGLSKSR